MFIRTTIRKSLSFLRRNFKPRFPPFPIREIRVIRGQSVAVRFWLRLCRSGSIRGFKCRIETPAINRSPDIVLVLCRLTRSVMKVVKVVLTEFKTMKDRSSQFIQRGLRRHRQPLPLPSCRPATVTLKMCVPRLTSRLGRA